ncbi:hypothetical protein ACEPAF_9208 [Sanghuangporus sanghuang]
MCSNMVNPFLDVEDELSGALDRFRHAADGLWRVIDKCASTLQKIDVEDYPDPFKTLGFLRATAHHFYSTLSDSQTAIDKMLGPSKKALKPLQSHIDSSAMKYGLNRLPTELLPRIFLDATSDMKSTIALSHVSKQFRSIVNRSPAIWRRIRLSSKWDREQILAIAERSAFLSLKAIIWPQKGVSGKGLDSATAIFSFHSCLEELSINYLSMEAAEEVRRRLGFLHFPSLQVLSSRKSDVLALQHPQQIFEMPLLHTLDADFLPHNSMARNLVKLSLNLREVMALANLLDVLSSASALQDLSVCVELRTEDAEQEVPDHKPVRLPGLVKLSLGFLKVSMRSASIVARKIRSSSLQTLVLLNEAHSPMRTTNDGPFQDILQSNPSFTELELPPFTSIDLCHIPPQVEVLVLPYEGYAEYALVRFNCVGTVSSHQIRLIRFRGFRRSGNPSRLRDCVYHIRAVLLDSGLNAVQFEFQDCPKCRNGSFNLEDAYLAFLD